MLIWKIFVFWAVFLHMSAIAPLLAFLHFVHFEAKNYERILPGNKRKYPGKKRKCPSVKKQMRIF